MSGAFRRPLLTSALVALASAAWLAMAVDWFRGVRRVPVLHETGRDQSPLDHYPSVSVIVPARDEGDTIETALRSVLAQDYPGHLEVVAVDDRSTDGTGAILSRLASERPETMRVIPVHELPDGWLGKNHALYLGAREAGGDWLLFTDADVRFSAGCLTDAVGYAAREGLDHLTLAPEIVSRGVALKSFVAAFSLVFEVTQRPWRASDPRAREAVGVGSFNLVRREAYLRAGTHRPIRMRPDDDMRLGRLLKEAGFRQGVRDGLGERRVAQDARGGGAWAREEHVPQHGLPALDGPLRLARALRDQRVAFRGYAPRAPHGDAASLRR